MGKSKDRVGGREETNQRNLPMQTKKHTRFNRHEQLAQWLTYVSKRVKNCNFYLNFSNINWNFLLWENISEIMHACADCAFKPLIK